MVKPLFITFVLLLLSMMSDARCISGCYCTDDSSCNYYCQNNVCQTSISIGERCSGYYVHPRECGSIAFCDPNSGWTCQYQKSFDTPCTYDYSCLSGNCDYKTKTCQLKSSPVNVLYPIVIPSVIVFFIVIIIIVSVSVRQQRMRALALYRNPRVVIPVGVSYSYQNAFDFDVLLFSYNRSLIHRFANCFQC